VSETLLPVARTVVSGLTSLRSDLRFEAEQLLDLHGTELIPALLEVAQEQYERWQKRRRKYRIIAITFLSIAVPLLATIIGLAIYFGATGRGNIAGILLSATLGPILGGGGGGILGGCSTLLLPPQELLSIADVLRRFRDVRAVGPLAASLAFPDARLRASSSAQLARLLPELTREQAQEIPLDRRLDLYKRIGTKMLQNDRHLLQGILHLAHMAEDVQAVPNVTALVTALRGMRRASDSESLRVLEAKALACAERLGEVAAQQSEAGTLLRAASGDGDGLLRPAGSSPTQQEEALLRPASGNSEN
jgi:hypothetical protein